MRDTDKPYIAGHRHRTPPLYEANASAQDIDSIGLQAIAREMLNKAKKTTPRRCRQEHVLLNFQWLQKP